MAGGMALTQPVEVTFDDQVINEGKLCSLCGVSLEGAPIPLKLTMEGKYANIDVELCLSCANMLKTSLDELPAVESNA